MNVEMVDYKAPDAAASMARSLHETGFAVLYNHPITATRIDSIYQGWGDFFAGEAKFDFAVQPPRHDGYFAFRSENARILGQGLKRILSCLSRQPAARCARCGDDGDV